MNRLLCCLIVALSLYSCAQPTSYETFIRACDVQAGLYRFNLDMTDSLCRYDLTLFTKIDGVDHACQQPLHVVWISPSEKVYSETVYMNVNASGESRQAYRSAIEPTEYGVWNLMVFPVNPPEGLCGMGLICERKTASNGTR